MSLATPQYLALEKKVHDLIQELTPQFPDTMDFTISDETYQWMGELLEKGQKIRHGQVINPVVNPRKEIMTDALPDIVYFSNTQKTRIGAVRLANNGLEHYIL